MDFGLFTEFTIRNGETQREAFEESFKQVEIAEKLGIDTVWLGEHHFSPERSVLASPFVIASSIATRTSTIRIGIAVYILPLTNPLRIAEEAATVDHISKGRFNFGIGRSGLTRYYNGYNIPYSESRGRFFEALDIVMKAWREDQFTYEGEYYSFHDVIVVPKPYQKPHPPIHVAVEAPETFTQLGSMVHPIFIHAHTPDPIPLLQERLELYRKARKEAGHSEPGDVVLRIPAYLAETAEKARSEPEASTMQMVEYGAKELSSTGGSQETIERLQAMASLSYDELLKQRLMYGTPEAIAERLDEYKEKLGISGVVLEMNYGGQIPYDRIVNSIRLLCEKVAPKFK